MIKIARNFLFLMFMIVYSTSLSATSVANFISAAEILKQKGRSAVFTSEFDLLNKEADSSLEMWKSQTQLARPKICPTDNATDMNVIQFIDLLKTVPVRQRNISVRAAVTKIMNIKYRCDRARK